MLLLLARVVIMPNGHSLPYTLGAGPNGSHDVPSPLHTSDEEDVWVAKCRWQLLGRWVYGRWRLFVAKRRANALRGAAAATAAALERAWVHEKEEGSPGSIEGDVRSRAGLADLSDAADFWRGLITDLSDAELDNLALTVGEQQARRRRPKRGGLSPQREGGREEG